jgi:pantoate--beta-alanine ligase
METTKSLARARALFAALPRPLGFVPTMGALHAGHLALVAEARRRSASVAASVFVNPLQFAPNEDLAAYPRDLRGDRRMLARAGVDVLFAPDSAEMFGGDFATFVDVGPLGSVFEGALRPSHFRGVTTVIAKLLHVAQPDAIYLGQKDAQQTAVLRRMVRDLAFPVEVRIVPTVREPDGLAMSSRNRYLAAGQRARAPSLYRALLTMREALERGRTKKVAIAAAAAVLDGAARLDYLDLVDADTFEPLERLRAPAFIIGAARFGKTRLIDNLLVKR